MSKVGINCNQLAGLYHTARQNGTLDAFGDLAVEWAKKASIYITRLSEENEALRTAINRVLVAYNGMRNESDNYELFTALSALRGEVEK